MTSALHRVRIVVHLSTLTERVKYNMWSYHCRCMGYTLKLSWLQLYPTWFYYCAFLPLLPWLSPLERTWTVASYCWYLLKLYKSTMYFPARFPVKNIAFILSFLDCDDRHDRRQKMYSYGFYLFCSWTFVETQKTKWESLKIKSLYFFQLSKKFIDINDGMKLIWRSTFAWIESDWFEWV